MIRRLAYTGAVAALMCALTPSLAFAWANGPAKDGVEGNGYGTHDWVLDAAIELAGKSGEWIDETAALEASDDPDTYSYNTAYHLYRDDGVGRGAPYKVASLYHLAVEAYKVGDYSLASEYVGELSHYYADISQPFHTDYDAMKYDALHLEYEYAVDDETHHPGDMPTWIVAASRQPVTDARAKTIAAAKYSRARFPSLVSAYASSHSLRNATVDRITREIMSRAANDLADIIATIPTGEGIAPAPATVTTTVSRTYVAQNSVVAAFARCVDADGSPMEGVGVLFKWPLPTGTRTVLAYSEPDGIARYYQNIGATPLMSTRTVNVSATSADQSSTASTWYMATPVLASSRTGFRTAMSSYRPKQNTYVTCSAKAVSTSGKAVKGLKVTFTWKFKGSTVRYTTTTNSKGMAYSKRNIGRATKGYRVYVTATTQAGGVNRSSKASFIPK